MQIKLKQFPFICVSLLLITLVLAKPAQAIIVTPALVLLPVTKIIAAIFTALSIPLGGWIVWREKIAQQWWKILVIILLLVANVCLVVYLVS